MDMEEEIFKAYKWQCEQEVDRLERQVEAYQGGQKVLMEQNQRLWAAVCLLQKSLGILWTVADDNEHGAAVSESVKLEERAAELLLGDAIQLEAVT